ncbi:MAG: protein kinase [Armatimonas sp.]
MSECATENTLICFVEGRLSQAHGQRLQTHIAECPDCRRVLAALAHTISAPELMPLYAASLSDQRPLSSDTATPFQPPPQIAEYRVVERLGHGAMGQVFLGHDTILDRPVAIKFLSAAQPDDQARRRFLTEARAIARLQHPNVVSIYRIGEAASHLYLVSEFVRGQSLDKLTKPIPFWRALEIGISLARGLEVAHQRGVLHRDIKPSNAILPHEGEVKLLDFGLAKLAAEPEDLFFNGQPEAPTRPGARDEKSSVDAEALTQSGALVGTPRYAAPEIWRGERATARSDIYALGALLYELCAGHSPHHTAVSMRELQHLVLGQEPPPLTRVVSPMRADFSAVVMRCLQRHPEQRFASAAALCTALERVRAKHRSRLPRRLGRGLVALVAAGTIAAALRHVAMPVQPCGSDNPCPIEMECRHDSGACVRAQPGWHPLPRMSKPRGYTCAAYAAGTAYVFGGVMEAAGIGFQPPIASVEKFDFHRARWSAATPMPVATLASACVTLQDKIYILGGRVGVGAESSENSNIVQIYNPATDTWEAADRMNRLRAWAGAAVLDGKIYVVGGAGRRTSALPSGYENSAEVYDPRSGTWKLLDAQLAAGRYMLGVVTHGGRLYAVGGASWPAPGVKEPVVEHRLIESWAPGTPTWQVVGNLSEPSPALEVLRQSDGALLLLAAQRLYRTTLPAGRLSAVSALPKGVAAHDSGIVLTPYGLLTAGGGGWLYDRAQVYLYRFPAPP